MSCNNKLPKMLNDELPNLQMYELTDLLRVTHRSTPVVFISKLMLVK